MRRHLGRSLATIVAALMLAVSVSTATAGRFEVSELNFRAFWDVFAFRTAGIEILCPLTVTGRFHEPTVPKVSRWLLGTINTATLGACNEGGATVLGGDLPWFITYNGFVGTLPSIRAIRALLINASFRVASSGIACLAKTDSTEPAAFAAAYGFTSEIREIQMDESLLIDIDDPSFLCSLAGDVSVSGQALLRTALPINEVIFVPLI